ncbi:MAG: cytochrome C oxidase subunit IV family protein [Balneolaceae bacterium]|nr:cytochrome C oxidase subunit IV family protein [Balneolaceae bacterium]
MSEHHAEEHHHHISTDRTLWTVAIALFILTIVTAGVHFLHLPNPWSIIVAMTIAFFKAGLVALVFMQLWWDRRFNGMLLFFSLVFLALLIGLTLLDTLFRAPSGLS